MRDVVFYNVHDFLIAVDGPANEIFLKEYGWAKVDTESKDVEANLIVKLYQGSESLPTKPVGSLQGMYLPFGEDERVLWYEKGCPLNHLLNFCEALMYWPDKTLLHAGSVAKSGKAFIFTGSGNIGKTSIVLNLLKEGYEYLSDDWLVIGGGKAYSLPKLIHVFDYNLKNKEIANSVLGLKQLYYKPFFKILELGKRISPHRYMRFAFEVIKPMFRVDLKKINSEAKVMNSAVFSKVFYLERRDTNKIKVENDVTAEELARRMAYVNLYEWYFFFREYYRYVYLYGVKNAKIENRLEHDFDIMYDTFKKAELQRAIIPLRLDLTSAKLTSLINVE